MTPGAEGTLALFASSNTLSAPDGHSLRLPCTSHVHSVELTHFWPTHASLCCVVCVAQTTLRVSCSSRGPRHEPARTPIDRTRSNRDAGRSQPTHSSPRRHRPTPRRKISRAEPIMADLIGKADGRIRRCTVRVDILNFYLLQFHVRADEVFTSARKNIAESPIAIA